MEFLFRGNKLALVAVFAATFGAAQASEQIVGGTLVSEDDLVAASTVALMWEDVLVCSGTILDADLVLTAAHCLGLPTEVLFGPDSQSASAPRRKIVGQLAHPGFDITRYDQGPVSRGLDDVALVRIEGGLPAGARPAFLADAMTAFATGDSVVIAGYGASDGAEETGEGPLRQARVHVLDAGYDSSEFKIDAASGSGDCFGDSGGPAYAVAAPGAPIVVLGVDNWGEGDCNRFGVYARASFHRAWIEQASAELRARATQPLSEQR